MGIWLSTSTTDEGAGFFRLSCCHQVGGISPGGMKLAAMSPSAVDSVVKAPVVRGLDSVANDEASWLVVVLGRSRLTGSNYFPTISRRLLEYRVVFGDYNTARRGVKALISKTI